ncbi:MAG TPA: GTP 3',8-cyclase MoaA [Chitinophagaceae bacterium]|nr:GTP 3',8-cyclase MoaA [Chitinophagaceae bacterium]
MIIDSYNRVHDYLRISLTDNCNLRCFYCMPEEEYAFAPAAKLMQPAEIETLAKIFVAQGVKKIRLTGGEPLVRKDAANIITLLAALPVELTMTTNGARLHEFASLFTQTGIRSINISLDTLHEEKFTLITRRPIFKQVKSNIDLALQLGMHVKVNMVVMKGMNDDEVVDFVGWTKDQPVHVRFIEFMPFTGNRWTSNKVFSYQEILSSIATTYEFDALAPKAHDTAKSFRVPGHAGTFAVISTMTEPFCSSCNRMRLTADGKLKNCLFSIYETDLLTPLRNGEDILPLIQTNIKAKEKELGGQFTTALQTIEATHIQNRPMITIGG